MSGGVNNILSDSLSRMKLSQFKVDAGKQGHQVNLLPENIPDELWPMNKMWSK